MELSNEFEVDAPIGQVWAVLTDVERIAPCLPGAQLQEIEGDEFRGIVRIKVGPITAQYKGAASFAERDDASYRAVLRAEGRDTRGAGNAAADITAQLEETEGGTRVAVETDLKVTGKVAQFGRGVMADVSRKLMSQFADNLSGLIADDAPEAADEVVQHVIEVPDEVERVRVVDAPEAEALDLLDAAGASVVRRLLPLVLVAAVVVVVVLLVV
ncbi:MAG: SRPBCC family protein [Acidimicrobiales bacterium]|nr:SRPBCC family protein [Acidimicrobiales bacterium]MDP6697307.1 SRPBCC family protein [Acidimicrobiales bacterium]